jgi:hypothetical protein
MNTTINESALPPLTATDTEKGQEKQTEEIYPSIVIADDLDASIGMCTSHCAKKGTRG